MEEQIFDGITIENNLRELITQAIPKGQLKHFLTCQIILIFQENLNYFITLGPVKYSKNNQSNLWISIIEQNRSQEDWIYGFSLTWRSWMQFYRNGTISYLIMIDLEILQNMDCLFLQKYQVENLCQQKITKSFYIGTQDLIANESKKPFYYLTLLPLNKNDK